MKEIDEYRVWGYCYLIEQELRTIDEVPEKYREAVSKRLSKTTDKSN